MRTSDSRTNSSAASALKNACLVWSVTWKRWFTSAASALSTSADAERASAKRRNPSNKVSEALSPADTELDPAVTVLCVRSSNRVLEFLLQDELPLREGIQLPMTSRLPAAATDTCPRACTMAGCACTARRMASPKVTVGRCVVCAVRGAVTARARVPRAAAP